MTCDPFQMSSKTRTRALRSHTYQRLIKASKHGERACVPNLRQLWVCVYSPGGALNIVQHRRGDCIRKTIKGQILSTSSTCAAVHDGGPLRGDVPRSRSQAPQRQRGARHAMIWPCVVAEMHNRARRETLRQVSHDVRHDQGPKPCVPPRSSLAYGHACSVSGSTAAIRCMRTSPSTPNTGELAISAGECGNPHIGLPGPAA